jgi:hypothetical protein
VIPTTLLAGQVLTIGRASNLSVIEVRSGAIWLTETPADADLVLNATDRFHLNRRWPVVIQALEDAEIILRGSLPGTIAIPREYHLKRAPKISECPQ